MTTLGQIGRALRDVEATMPPHLLRLYAASAAVRAAYAQHRRALAAWHAQHAPDAYARWVDRQIEEPPEPPALLRAIFPPMRVLRVGDDAADAWRCALEAAR